MGNSDPPLRMEDRDLGEVGPAETVSDISPRPKDPAPMSVDSVDPASIPTPSDESWTDLSDRTCGNATPVAGDREREKRPRPPDFVPEKRRKQDALRTAFVHNEETLKAHCTHWAAYADGAPTIGGLEAALTALAAKVCERPLVQELSRDEELRFAQEVDAAKKRELDAWCKFQVSSPVPQKSATKGVVETRWVPTWKDLDGKRTVKGWLTPPAA